jgi:hypothetical protein
MQPLKIRLHPSGICKISKTDMLIRPLKGHRNTVPHPRVASVEPPELQPVHFEKMNMHDVLYNVTERIVCLKCWFCGPDKGTLHAYACIMCVHSICITEYYTVIQTYVRSCTATGSPCTHCVHGLATGLPYAVNLQILLAQFLPLSELLETVPLL